MIDLYAATGTYIVLPTPLETALEDQLSAASRRNYDAIDLTYGADQVI
ncbi:hypothetical protein GCM10025865_33890 (plasmid) [Paraoerskovia sediminicola]|uniref:Uncharacterized protein n=1 Tax=Paraoerskovia sediminicola TaxID=1138587 RepID=A0ABN6XH27_9CELL|nr:hypothetical protein [Paraoerskovia sediminicola]BDZ44045.1 hypothetical protein GCM10025865_33440 [Paraoerskovia sediminicola]BDZ44090.1 hypothetical protein GCM10025865_33890 [Paraoerskovia sediminicola]